LSHGSIGVQFDDYKDASFCSTADTGNSNNGLDIFSFATWFYVQDLGVPQTIISRGQLPASDIIFEIRTTAANGFTVI